MEHTSCYAPQCIKRATCTLWHNALTHLKQGVPLLTITNPTLIEASGGYEHCPLYHEHKLRQFARALIWKYPEMTLEQTSNLHDKLISHFGYSNIVRMRCGYEAITPEQQAKIEAIFHEVAPGFKPHYKSFEVRYTKPPRVEGKAVHKLIK